MSEKPAMEFIKKRLTEIFDPKMAKGWDRVIQFEIEGEGDLYVEVKNQQLNIVEGKHEKPDIKIWIEPQTLIDLFSGKLAAPTAMAMKKMRYEGSMGDAMRLMRVFPVKK